ncbi:hypothetical protein N7520_004275 [Penicillium odoratum]|uniref:uncharacterized protein n=1 Tax=Penicillium odoratum TaxID=1167516 RepID=UPI002548F2AB|nr:uncharacterized protein N7520_004275 [Penicillium odoratum]KAJ5764716.1 hypothetical protein N7520_004275 [Penicillium odoratum]
MLTRARKLQSCFDEYCTTNQYTQFKLNDEEWRQVEYLLLITKPFFDFTNVLSKTRDCTVHHIFSIYNRLFSHLEEAEKKLRCKRVHWKKSMLQELQLAQKKLSKYYSGTDDSVYGTTCALATILYPPKKLRYFDNKDWRGGDIDFMRQYQDAFRNEFVTYQKQAQREAHQPDTSEKIDDIEDEELAMLCDSQQTTLPTDEFDGRQDEVTRYLSKGLSKGNPRVYWKEHEQEFPVLARIARDILSIPASGAGVERLFKYARDICHYRRGQLRPDTIKGLMLHHFSSKFELKQTEIEMIKEYLLSGEAAMLDQSRLSPPSLEFMEPISDNEEEGYQEELQEEDSDNDVDELAISYSLKRPVDTLDLDDSALLDGTTFDGTQTRTGRIRKKPWLPDGFEMGQP